MWGAMTNHSTGTRFNVNVCVHRNTQLPTEQEKCDFKLFDL